METATQDKLANAKASAKATFEHIKELVERLHTAREQAEDGPDETYAPLTDIQEHPLSVEVRSDWHAPGPKEIDQDAPVEYRILISTGGPAVQIVGRLNDYDEPKSATLQCQDWFTPWTDVYGLETAIDPAILPEDILLAYARCFYFGE